MQRFGVVVTLELDPDYRKAYVEFEDFISCDYAIKSFEDKETEDLRAKYLISENRESLLKSLKSNGAEKIELTSENLNKIAGAYNGYSFEGRKQQLDRDLQRQRVIAEMLDKEKDSILNNLG